MSKVILVKYIKLIYMIGKRERIFYYDLLRAIAIISVICCHVGKYTNHSSAGLSLIFIRGLHWGGMVGVPIFLMISGALLLNKDYDLKTFFKKRFSRVVYPFIFWMIIIMGFGFLWFNWSNSYAWKVFTGNPSIIWYIWMLIGVYLCVPVINSFIKDYGLKGLEYFLAIWFVTIILKTFDLYPPLPYLNLDFFAGFLGFFILGYYLDNKDFKLRNSLICLLGFVIFLISLVSMINLGMIDYSFLKPNYENISNVFLGVGMFLFIKYLCKFNSFDSIKDRIIGKMIISISICSYGMYYAHYLINKFFLKEFSEINSNKYAVIILILLIVLSWTLTYILSKIPFLKKFSGA